MHWMDTSWSVLIEYNFIVARFVYMEWILPFRVYAISCVGFIEKTFTEARKYSGTYSAAEIRKRYAWYYTRDWCEWKGCCRSWKRGRGSDSIFVDIRLCLEPNRRLLARANTILKNHWFGNDSIEAACYVSYYLRYKRGVVKTREGCLCVGIFLQTKACVWHRQMEDFEVHFRC